MPLNAQCSVTVNIGGMNISATKNLTNNDISTTQPTLPAGKAGTLATRTSDTQGTATLGGGHGITDGDTVDVYWDGGVRYGMVVGTVAGNSVPLTDSGDGDNLPAESTAIVVSPTVEVNLFIDGDEITLAALRLLTTDPQLATAGHVVFLDDDDAEIAVFPLIANNLPTLYIAGGGTDNPYTGDAIVKAIASNANPTVEAQLQIGVLQDATP
jgi:hypothetical protein